MIIFQIGALYFKKKGKKDCISKTWDIATGFTRQLEWERTLYRRLSPSFLSGLL